MFKKDYLKFNLADISTYRTQLMGLATFMILVCHAPASHVLMPRWVTRVCSIGNFGVDIFLFLSGLGLYYSLSRIETIRGIFIWYQKRFSRIFIPYLIIYVPYCIILQLLKKYSIVDSILCLSTLEYWFFHRGAWFVSLILVLYLVTPLLYKYLFDNSRWLWIFCLLFCIVALSNIDLIDMAPTNMVCNIQWTFGRVPSFILGMAISKSCMDEIKISVFWILIFTVLWALSSYVFHQAAMAWLIVPLLLYLSVALIKMLSKVSRNYTGLSFLGEISLESYLTNITLNSILIVLIPAYIASPLFYGRYLEYLFVIVVGLYMAYRVNTLTKSMMNHLLRH